MPFALRFPFTGTLTGPTAEPAGKIVGVLKARLNRSFCNGAAGAKRLLRGLESEAVTKIP